MGLIYLEKSQIFWFNRRSEHLYLSWGRRNNILRVWLLKKDIISQNLTLIAVNEIFIQNNKNDGHVQLKEIVKSA